MLNVPYQLNTVWIVERPTHISCGQMRVRDQIARSQDSKTGGERLKINKSVTKGRLKQNPPKDDAGGHPGLRVPKPVVSET